MSETLNNKYEDTTTNFESEEYAFDIEALKDHYNRANEVGKLALGLVEVETKE